MNEQQIVEGKRLGKGPAKSSTKALMFARFVRKEVKVPEVYDYWKKRTPFPIRSFGNINYGSCTRSKQAIAAMRMERIETRQTPKISDDEVVRCYLEMTTRLYGGGDTGAYETDALSEWRKPDLTFRDTKGRPLTIDAFMRIDSYNHSEIKQALVAGGPKGIAVCFNLPAAWISVNPPAVWDVPEGQPLVGPWMPGTWGGHSMWLEARYDREGCFVAHTWNQPAQKVSWRGMAAYCDEAHSVLDSLDSWRKRLEAKSETAKLLNFDKIKDAVNSVSDMKIK